MYYEDSWWIHVHSEMPLRCMPWWLKEKLLSGNSCSTKKKEKAAEPSHCHLHTLSQGVTNDQGLAEAHEDWEWQQEKKQKESEKISQKAAKEKENIVRHATQGSTQVFSGPLSTKNKTDLEDISNTLGLSITGTKPILVERITKHFKKFPHLKEDPWFLSLFERAPRGWKQAVPVQDATGLKPPTQRQCVDSESLPYENQIFVASSSCIQLPFQPVPSSYFNTFSVESSYYHTWYYISIEFKYYSFFLFQAAFPVELHAVANIKIIGMPDLEIFTVTHLWQDFAYLCFLASVFGHGPTASINCLKFL